MAVTGATTIDFKSPLRAVDEGFGEVGVDLGGVQSANTVLAGPVAGGTNTPAFRVLEDADIPAAIARDTEVDTDIDTHAALDTGIHGAGASTLATEADIATHAAAADPHIGYQKESEKGQANGYAGLSASSIVEQDAVRARGLRETSGPTNLAMGAVADGEYLMRDGATIVGAPVMAVTYISFGSLPLTGQTYAP
jgi:hypothetical protein